MALQSRTPNGTKCSGGETDRQQKRCLINYSDLSGRCWRGLLWGLGIPCVLLILGTSGCTTLSTAEHVDLPSGQVNGMLYYLPIGKITISGKFEDVTLPTSESQVATRAPAQPSASPARGELETAPSANVESAPSPKETKATATQLTITMTAEVEADESAGTCYTRPHANYLFEDDVDVKINKNHLLETGNVKTEDKTVAIVQEVASLASQIARAPTRKTAVDRRPFDFTFRPSVFKSYNYVKQQLANRGITFKVDPEPLADDKRIVFRRDQANALEERGLLFRPAIAYNVSINFGDTVSRRQQFLLPDPSRTYAMDYPRISFVKREKNIGFSDGMLTEFHQITPSPILGFLGLPKAILKGVLPVPGG